MSAIPLLALGMGLLGSTHCVAMCGGISALLGSRRTVAFQLGRVAAYGALGAVAASLGALPAEASFLRFALRSLAAVCMLTVGLHLAGLPSSVRLLESVGAPVWRQIAPLARRFVPLRSAAQALVAGALWAFMPCGLLYGAVALAASAGSATAGALTMLAFGLGTVPAMIGVALFARRVTGTFARPWVRRAAGAVVLAFGLWSATGLAREALGTAPHACCHPR